MKIDKSGTIFKSDCGNCQLETSVEALPHVSIGIWNLGTKEEHRGKGLASNLIKEVQEFYKKMYGIKRFHLVCLDHMIPFYEGLGFSLAKNRTMRMESVLA